MYGKGKIALDGLQVNKDIFCFLIFVLELVSA